MHLPSVSSQISEGKAMRVNDDKVASKGKDSTMQANSEEVGRGSEAKISSYTTAFSVDTIDVLVLTLTAPRNVWFYHKF